MIHLFYISIASLFLSGKDEPKYPVSAIPEDLKTGMYAVIRESEFKFEITSINSSTLYSRTVITILNANAKNYAEEVIGYDKFNTIKSFKGVVYDANGEVIKKLKQSDIYDQSSFDGFSLFSDNRLKRADLSQAVYPYTVEFEYEVQKKTLYYIPPFYLYRDDEISIQKSNYAIVYPKELKPRYKTFNLKEPQVSFIDGKETMVWAYENFKPEKFEKLSVATNKLIPHVKAAPVDFEFDGYKGKMDSWENYGKWQAMLNKGRDVLPEATKQYVRELTKNVTTTEEKAKILYQFLQNKTRYVSIQLGIGGLQPFEAKVVDQTGYGDCKALSNYMVALLAEAGVKGYYTIIMGGDDATPVDPTFPSDQFNHIIVAVPNKKDTLWLECTSQTNPFGYLGDFTGNRYGLMVTETGGKLVKTVSYTGDQNIQFNEADVVVEMNGDAKAKVKTTYSGLQYGNNGLDFVVNKQSDDQKKWIQNNTGIPSFNVNSFSMTDHKDKIPSAIVSMDLSLPRYASVSGKRVFITPNLMNRSVYVPEKTEKRKTNIVRKMPYTDTDIINYQLPDGVYPEFLPAPVSIKSRFGEYEATFKVDDKGLHYTRKIKMNDGEFPADSYQELIDFYRGVAKADNTKLVFINKT